MDIIIHCLARNRSALLRALGDTKGVRQGEEAPDMADFEKVRRWLALLPFEDKAPGPLPLEDCRGGSALIVITSACSEALEASIAEAAPFFSAVTLVLVGDGHADTGLTPTLRLPVGCDVAAELVALE